MMQLNQQIIKYNKAPQLGTALTKAISIADPREETAIDSTKRILKHVASDVIYNLTTSKSLTKRCRILYFCVMQQQALCIFHFSLTLAVLILKCFQLKIYTVLS